MARQVNVSRHFRVIYAMWYRQVKRFLNMKARVVSSIVQPIMWLALFGVGFRRFATPMGFDYLAFLAPGVVMMAAFVVGFQAGASLIWDKEFGYFKEILVAPAPRAASLIGRCLGDATLALLNSFIILVAVYFFVPSINVIGILFVTAVAFLIALCFTSLGTLIAMHIRNLETFQLVMMLSIMPLMFLSSIFYPIDSMDFWMRTAAMLNPLTYGAELARYFLVPSVSSLSGMQALQYFVILVVITLVLLEISIFFFRKLTMG
ncbi:MAG: ABC transporter permease [Candidatus Baldrarchaeia archaeon]